MIKQRKYVSQELQHDRTIGVRFPLEVRNFSLHHKAQTGSGAQSAYYIMCSRGFFPWSKAHHSPPSSARIKNCGAMPPFPHKFYWYGFLLFKHRNNITSATFNLSWDIRRVHQKIKVFIFVTVRTSNPTSTQFIQKA
jgi:hypothetical protein